MTLPVQQIGDAEQTTRLPAFESAEIVRADSGCQPGHQSIHCVRAFMI
ncbi:MAG: hypothetical protein ACJ789_04100 [Thermomicrobiales bacterium]